MTALSACATVSQSKLTSNGSPFHVINYSRTNGKREVRRGERRPDSAELPPRGDDTRYAATALVLILFLDSGPLFLNYCKWETREQTSKVFEAQEERGALC